MRWPRVLAIGLHVLHSYGASARTAPTSRRSLDTREDEIPEECIVLPACALPTARRSAKFRRDSDCSTQAFKKCRVNLNTETEVMADSGNDSEDEREILKMVYVTIPFLSLDTIRAYASGKQTDQSNQETSELAQLWRQEYTKENGDDHDFKENAGKLKKKYKSPSEFAKKWAGKLSGSDKLRSNQGSTGWALLTRVDITATLFGLLLTARIRHSPTGFIYLQGGEFSLVPVRESKNRSGNSTMFNVSGAPRISWRPVKGQRPAHNDQFQTTVERGTRLSTDNTTYDDAIQSDDAPDWTPSRNLVLWHPFVSRQDNTTYDDVIQ
ncbi:Uu.00g012440.m01.CDS01 [Anthostomella pinea]|uniref:Uu.00g012440.m01.CDS01 n=1 Tax=Anthostomella pinea TaxID=933095 RepID=A0AAI8VYV5_9PEZI|nr:Uu.00g012440.m01.CDS01 [Anthostomella pinea]